MSLWRRVGAVGLLAFLALLIWKRDVLWRDSEPEGAVKRDATREVVRGIRAGAKNNSYAPARALPSIGEAATPHWLVEPGVSPRRIAGVVRDEAGKPVAGAHVALRSTFVNLTAQEPLAVTTGADGAFDFGEQLAMGHVVVAREGTRRPAVVGVDLRDPTIRPEALEVTLKACPRWVFGEVRGEAGEVVQGGKVSVVESLGFWHEEIYSVPLEADGSFAMCAVERAQVRAEGYATVRLDEMPAEGYRVRLGAASAVRGIVVDPEGAPVAGASVVLVPLGGVSVRSVVGPFSHTVMSSADGTFEFSGIGKGEFEVNANHGMFGFSHDPQRFSVVPGTDFDNARVEMTRCRQLAGTVLSDGKPVAGARVMERYTTQSDGSFVMACAGLREFTLTSPGYSLEDNVVPAGTEDLLDLVLEATPNPAIVGTVTMDGQPVAGATVALGDDWKPRARQAWVGRRSTTTASDGSFALRAMPEGIDTLTAYDERTGAMAQRPVDVQPGVTLPRLALELRGPADIRGSVLDKNDVALGGVRVSLYALREDLKLARAFGGQAPNQQTTTLEDGSYRFRNVEPGVQYALCVGSCYYHRKFDAVDPSYPTDGGWPRVRAASDGGHTRADLRIAIAAETP